MVGLHGLQGDDNSMTLPCSRVMGHEIALSLLLSSSFGTTPQLHPPHMTRKNQKGQGCQR